MTDYIVHAAGAGHQVRLFAATTREMAETARQIHQTSPVATAALGRLLTAGAMMASMTSGEDNLLTLQIRGDGPIAGLTVTAKSDGNVKGYVGNPDVMLPPSSKGKLDVGGAVGHGVLTVYKDLGLKEPYTGQTQLVSGEIAEDLAYYFAISEQTNSSVGLGVLMEKNNTVRQAGGFILQLMPDTSEEVIARLEENFKTLPSVTTMLENGMSPEDMIRRIMDGMDVEFYETLPTAYSCDCSKLRMEKALVSLGRKELQDMIDEGEPVEMGCQFCGRHFTFSVDDLKTLLSEAKKP